MAQQCRTRQEHPLCDVGKDATEDFEEIGHSNAAKDLLSKYIVGDFEVRLPKQQLNGTSPAAGLCELQEAPNSFG